MNIIFIHAYEAFGMVEFHGMLELMLKTKSVRSTAFKVLGFLGPGHVDIDGRPRR